MEYRELGELNPPFILPPRTLFDYRQAILLFKPAFYPTRSPPPVHQTPPPLSRIFKVGAVHTVITIKPRSRPPSLPYIYPPSRYLGLSGTIKRVCAIAIAIVVAREKGEKKIVDAGKEQKGSAEAFSERAHIQREVRRGCVRAPPSSLSLSLSLRIRRCSWLDPWAKRRGPYEERGEHEEDEGAERGTDRSVRERNPRLPWLPSHSRLASLPWRRLAALSPSLSLSPLSPALCPSPSSTRSLSPSLSLRCSLSRTSPPSGFPHSAFLPVVAPSFSLPLRLIRSYSLRAPWDEEEERAGEIKRNARAR